MAATDRMNRTTYDTPSDCEISITREFNAPRSVVFEAWTTPAALQRWQLGPEGWTMPVCEFDLRPGGTHRRVWRRTTGTEMVITGVFREIEPPERLVMTTSWGGDWPEMVETLLLTERQGRTIATLTILYPSKEARDAAAKTGMKDGLEPSFERLDQYLAGAE